MRGIRKNKRRGADLVVRSKNIMIYSAWILFFFIFVLLSMAKPRQTTMFDRFYNVSVNQAWDPLMLNAAFLIMPFLMIICAIGLYFNSKRLKRKTDSYSLSLIIFGSLSAVGVLLYPFIS